MSKQFAIVEKVFGVYDATRTRIHRIHIPGLYL
jgi:hypothetical protein